MANRDETLTTNRSVDEAIRAGTQTMESLGLKVKKTGNASLEGKGGNKLIVYWIGLFLPNSSMPVKVNYNVTESGGARTVEMHTHSGLLLAFYRWKFKACANHIADALKQGVAAQLS